MAQCAGISIGAEFNCKDLPIADVNDRVILVNRDDIDTITYSTSPNDNVITDITLKSGGKQGYAFFGSTTHLPRTELVAGDAGTISTWNHVLGMTIFEVTSEQKDNIQAMLHTKLVAIVENANDSGNGDSVFEVFGVGRGLKPASAMRENANGENGGGWVLELTSPQGSGESNPPNSWFDTDYGTTKAKVDAILTPTV